MCVWINVCVCLARHEITSLIRFITNTHTDIYMDTHIHSHTHTHTHIHTQTHTHTHSQTHTHTHMYQYLSYPALVITFRFRINPTIIKS